MSEQQTPFEGWAILELMGHRRLAGYVREQELAGSGFVRIDVPGLDEDVATQFYSPAAVYCITPTTEDVARQTALLGDLYSASELGHDLHLPHFATCPQAEQHRRPRQNAAA